MSRLDEVKSKYPKLNIEVIAKKDPSNNFKYLNWMCREINSGAKKADVYGTISGYHTYINALKQDLDKVSCKELEDKVKEHLFSLKVKDLNVVEGIDYKKRFEDDDCLVVEIFSREAAIKYGKGTKWCISSVNNDYFDEYSENRIFFLINKKDESKEKAKLAITINGYDYNQSSICNENVIIYNSLDKTISIIDLIINYNFFVNYIKYVLPLGKKENDYDMLLKTANDIISGENGDDYYDYTSSFVFIFKNFEKYKNKISLDALNCFGPSVLEKYKKYVKIILSEKYEFSSQHEDLNLYILENYTIKNNPIKNKKELDKFVEYYSNDEDANSFFCREKKIAFDSYVDFFLKDKITSKKFKAILEKNKDKIKK